MGRENVGVLDMKGTVGTDGEEETVDTAVADPVEDTVAGSLVEESEWVVRMELGLDDPDIQSLALSDTTFWKKGVEEGLYKSRDGVL